MTFHLKNWSVVYYADSPFVPPEFNPICLQGTREEDNRCVRTSPIVEINGKSITTESGSTYHLLDPSCEYLKYLKDIGYHFDPENPIKDKRFLSL